MKTALLTSQPMGFGRRLWMSALLGSLAAFGPLTMDMYLPGFPVIAENFQTSAPLVQLSLTASLLGIAAGQLFFGPLSDSKGRKNPLLISLVVYMVASILCVFAPTIFLFIAARFIQGLAASSCVVISRAVVRDMFSGSELTKFFALLMLVNGLAPILAPIFGGVIIEHSSWYMVFVVLCIIGAIMFFTVMTALPETLSIENRTKTSIKKTVITFSDLIKDRSFLGYALTQGLMMAGMFAYISGTPFIYQGIYGVSPQTFSFLFALNGLGLVLATQIAGRLAGRVSEKKILSVGLFIPLIASFILMLMILLKAPLVFVVVPLFFVISSCGITNTCSFSLAMETQGHRAGSAAALLGLLPFLLGAITAPLVGIAGESTAVPMGIIIVITTAGAFSSFFFLSKNHESKNASSTSVL